jgi:ligand-binding sensor domain-containing protein
MPLPVWRPTTARCTEAMNILCLLFLLLLGHAAIAQLPYREGDWTSYLDSRQVAALDCGRRYLFAASKGGVLFYDLIRKRWDDPQVIGYSVSEAIPIEDAVQLIFDEDTNYLWVCTAQEVLRWDVLGNRWRRDARDLWFSGERVVNMGIGKDSVYIEVIPGTIYSQLFTLGSPLPADGWQPYVRRFGGDRNFGGFRLDFSEPNPYEQIRWRGLRSKVPLTNDQLYGQIGIGPANFPDLNLTDGSLFLASGEVQDRFLRNFLLTDWMVDAWGTFWFSTWGAGIGNADLRSHFTEMYTLGPAGNRIEALIVDDNNVWMGGDNQVPLAGITRCTRDFRKWGFFEPRADAQILSTVVHDFEETAGTVWVASEEGLLAFNKKKSSWLRLGINDGLWNDRIRALAANDSQLWVGTDRGLNLITLPGMTVWRQSQMNLRDLGILKLRLDGDTLYIGTPNGLFRGSIVNRVFDYSRLDPGLLEVPIRDISVTGDEVWLATRQGIQVYNSTSGITRSWDATVYLGGEQPTCLLATAPAVWVGTGNGFWRWWRERNEWVSYTVNDGLVNDEVEIIRRDGDYLLIGTARGLTRFFWNDPRRAK